LPSRGAEAVTTAGRLSLKPALLAVLIVAFAAALRVFELDRLSFWFDESATVHFSRMDPWEIWGRDTHPPLYYLLIHGWLLLGDSEWWLRLLSVLFSLGTVVGLYAAGRRLGGERVGLIAAALLALASFELRFAQEARMYALLGCAVAFSLAGLMALLARPGDALAAGAARHWRSYVIGSVLAVYSHNMGFLWPLAASAAALAVFWPEPARRPLLLRSLKANLIVLACWLPYWPWLLHQADNVLSGFHLRQPRADRLFGDLAWIHLGVREPEKAWQFIGIGLGLAVLLLGLATLRRRLALALLLLMLVPLGASLAFVVWQPLYANRTLIWTALPSALAAAAGLDWLWRRQGRLLPALAVALFAVLLAVRGGGSWVYVYDRQKADWRGVMETLRDELPDGAVVVLSPGFEDLSWTYYQRRLRQEGTPLPKLELVQVLRGRQAEAMEALIAGRPEHVTFILSRWFGTNQLVDPQEFVERTLGCARLVERRVFTGILLLGFSTGTDCAKD